MASRRTSNTERYRRLYQGLIRTSQPEWDKFREGAHQALGMPPSKMYDTFSSIPQGSREHLQIIADTHTPHIMARHIEAEHEDRKLGVKVGGGFLDTIKDTAAIGTLGAGAYLAKKTADLVGVVGDKFAQGLTYVGEQVARVPAAVGDVATAAIAPIEEAAIAAGQGRAEQALVAGGESLLSQFGNAAISAVGRFAPALLGAAV